MNKFLNILATVFLITFVVALFYPKAEADNFLRAYGQSYKVTETIRVHKVDVGGVICIITDKKTRSYSRSSAITCDWENQE